jgi:drug/metabolite transporter (DMT)-like permease
MAVEASASQPRERTERRGMLLALLAVIAFATSPVFVLAAAPLSAFVITFGRMAVGSIWVILLGRLYRQPILPNRADRLLFVGIGLITALHFLSYIASLSFTTIAQSLAIVYTAPIFVALFSATLLHEPISSRKWLGVVVTVAGIAILVGFQPQMDARMAFGDLLALVSAVTFGLYSVAGRSQRARYGLFTYTGTVYGMAALWALPAASLTLQPAALTLKSVSAVVAAGLIPLGLGHTLYNAALRRTHATLVNLIATQEVTGGIVLGAILLGQVPQANEIIGAVVALAGIAVVLI